ncbi:hypothetical protein RA19_17765 [Leisingera sp. ANG-M1]|uniref:energy transducer TonB n=1 Tax=Leisingera sp. ANG-M1 TaxID=1577895 RepID=UPI00057EF4B4|nr:TonB family protein [Leisingera sp. ANG-M1]KIC08739.1 hypothetical protein RA19_17765 [Leisingera sp. ANG-M1]
MRVPQSRLMGLAAVFAAAAGHAGFAYMASGEQAEQAGGNTGLAAEGYAFADLVQGTDVPETTSELLKAETIEVAKKPVQEPVLQPVLQLQPLVAEAVRTEAVAVRAPVANAEPVLPFAQTEPVETQQVADPVQPQFQAESAGQQQPEAAETAPEPDVQEPLPEPKPEPKPEPRPEPEPDPKPRRKQQRGNNTEANAAAGTVTGTAAKNAGQAASAPGAAKQQGNAAADNYRGQVLRRVMRAKRQKVNIRGAALVRFTITGSGALGSARIAKSSGSAKLDSIALAQVRRAAPFPPPPAGAKTTYSVRIKGK